MTRPDIVPAYDHALTYLAHGLAVFPLRPRDKQPLAGGHGVKDATRETGRVTRWWQAHRDANIAIATGAVSGVVVLDIDGDEGLESIRKLLVEQGVKMPRTPTVETGSGMHLYFRHPGTAIKNSAKTIPGLDVRADGGYVVAPPSVHPTGGSYKWIVTLDEPFAPIPDYLMAALFQPADAPSPTPAGGIVPAGRRNDTAFRDASGMRRRGMGSAAILAALRADNGTRYIPPLDDAELERIVASAERYSPDKAALDDEEWQHRQLEKREADKPVIRLRVTTSTPKTWHVIIGEGNVVKVSTEQLLSWSKIKAAHVEQLMALPTWEPKMAKKGEPGEWADLLRELVPAAEKIDAPEELTTRGRVLEFVRIFCARHSTSSEALTRGSVWYNADGADGAGEFVFRTGDMVRSIERDYGLAKTLSAREVNEVLREHFGGAVRTQRVGKTFLRVMALAADRVGITPQDEDAEPEEADDVRA